VYQTLFATMQAGSLLDAAGTPFGTVVDIIVPAGTPFALVDPNAMRGSYVLLPLTMLQQRGTFWNVVFTMDLFQAVPKQIYTIPEGVPSARLGVAPAGFAVLALSADPRQPNTSATAGASVSDMAREANRTVIPNTPGLFPNGAGFLGTDPHERAQQTIDKLFNAR
jgi:hypothetical protein